MSLIENYNSWLLRFITVKEDDEHQIFIKRLWVSLIFASIVVIIPNIIYCWLIGLIFWFKAALIFLVFNLFLLITFSLNKRLIRFLIILTQLFFIGFSFYYVVIGGGILATGGIVLVGLVGGPVASLIFYGRKVSVFMLVLYLFSVFIEYFISDHVSPVYSISQEKNLSFFVAHLVVITIAIFAIISYFIKKYREISQKESELLNKVLPKTVVREIMENGKVVPRKYGEASILFTDFIGFTDIAASIPPDKLISEINDIFFTFDQIIEEEGLEKIKTIGDGYLAVSGIPNASIDHAEHCISAAKRMLSFLAHRNLDNSIKWEIRAGIHTGSVIAGIVGENKFTYDIFGDTVNLASRLEKLSEGNKINVSAYTYELIKDKYSGEYRGKIEVKGKGSIDMYFVQ